MKKMLFIAVLLAAFPSFAAEDIFDGLYIKTKAGDNIELQIKPSYSVYFGPIENLATDAYALKKRGKTYYTVDTENTFEIKLSEFKGAVFQGKDYEYLSMHELSSREYRKGDQMYKNNFDGIDWGMIMHSPGQQIEIRKKTYPAEHQIYMEPKQEIQKGSYVFWAGHDIWFVRFN